MIKKNYFLVCRYFGFRYAVCPAGSSGYEIKRVYYENIRNSHCRNQ